MSINPKHDEMGSFINSVDVVMPSISTFFLGRAVWQNCSRVYGMRKISFGFQLWCFAYVIEWSWEFYLKKGDVKCLSKILEKLITKKQTYKYTDQEISEYAHLELSINKQMGEMLSLFKETGAL